jgi:hypothetical protein
MLGSLGEGHEHLLRKAAGEAVYPAGDGVLLVEEGRDSAGVRCEDGRGARVAADAEDRAGVIFLEYPSAAPQGFEE